MVTDLRVVEIAARVSRALRLQSVDVSRVLVDATQRFDDFIHLFRPSVGRY